MNWGAKMSYGEEGLLGVFLRSGAGGRYVPAAVVGSFRDDSDRLRQLVGGLPQQLVLAFEPSAANPFEATNSSGYCEIQFGPIISRKAFGVAHDVEFA